MSRPDIIRGVPFAGLVHLEEIGDDLACGLGAIIPAHKRDLRQRVPQNPGSDRVTLGLIGVQQAFGRCPLDDLGQLPSQVHGILHAEVETLPARRVMHVRGVARQQDPSVAIGRGLTRRIGEPGDPGRTVDPVVGPVDRDERLAEIAQGRLAGAAELLARSPGPAPGRSRRAC